VSAAFSFLTSSFCSSDSFNSSATAGTVATRNVLVLPPKNPRRRCAWARPAVNTTAATHNGRGWYKGAESRYGWSWLIETFPEETGDGTIDRDEISQLSSADFARLDRDGNNELNIYDFDWSGGNPMMSQFSQTDMIFDQLDLDFNGRLTRKKMMRFFDETAEGFDF
jgi:hypothetical protein